MKWISADEAQFSSGRKLYANRQIIGISGELELSEGYDGGIPNTLTEEDLVELADHMIERWTKFKAGL